MAKPTGKFYVHLDRKFYIRKSATGHTMLYERVVWERGMPWEHLSDKIRWHSKTQPRPKRGYVAEVLNLAGVP